MPPPPPHPSNPEHQEWIKRGQRILGGVLWLSTRRGPDFAYAVSATAQFLTKDLELLKTKLRDLMQYLSTTKTKSSLYLHPKNELTQFTICGDSSFAPSGKHSQSGFAIHLFYGNARCLILAIPTKIAESSAEAELYALAQPGRPPGT